LEDIYEIEEQKFKMPHATDPPVIITHPAVEDKRGIYPDVTATYGDWRDDLFQNGYAVIPNVVEEERAKEYVESMYVSMNDFVLLRESVSCIASSKLEV